MKAIIFDNFKKAEKVPNVFGQLYIWNNRPHRQCMSMKYFVHFPTSSQTIWVVASAALRGKNRIDNTTNRIKYIFIPDISNAPFNHFMINLTDLSETIPPPSPYSMIEGPRQNLIYSAPRLWPEPPLISFQVRRLNSSEKYFNKIFSNQYWHYAKPWLRKQG